jgi:hypothetical protein
MKIKLKYSCALFIVFTFSFFAQQVKKIGTNQNSINASALLELESTNKGLLLPRMTSRQRDDISLPPAGLMVWCTNNNGMYYYNGTDWITFNVNNYPPNLAICDGTVQTAVVQITSINGKVWIDRNLGASRAATSSTDYLAYGCLYQWGRGNDGHASFNWTSSTTGTPIDNRVVTVQADTDIPGYSSFIKITGTTILDWRSNDTNLRWQSTGSADNNPCPTNFRVPTSAELSAEFSGAGITSVSTLFNGPLKFTAAGWRNNNNVIAFTGTKGRYYSRTTRNGKSLGLDIFTIITSIEFSRVNAMSVRCIRDY